MNILLIAPKASDLTYQTEELKAILQSEYNVTPLLGKAATTAGLITVLVKNYEIIWFMGHSDEEGIVLSDGKLPLGEFAPLVKNSRLLLLNSCESVSMAGQIKNAMALDVIAYIGELEDKRAYRFGATFIQNLKRYGENYKRAFDESVMVGETNYVFLRSGRWSLMVDDLTKAMYELTTKVALLTQKVDTLEKTIETTLKQATEEKNSPSEIFLRTIAAVLVIIAILVGYGVYKLAG